MTPRLLRASAALMAILTAATALVGCASDPRYKEGLNWVVSAEQQRAQLNAAGFPQYDSQ